MASITQNIQWPEDWKTSTDEGSELKAEHYREGLILSIHGPEVRAAAYLTPDQVEELRSFLLAT